MPVTSGIFWLMLQSRYVTTIPHRDDNIITPHSLIYGNLFFFIFLSYQKGDNICLGKERPHTHSTHTPHPHPTHTEHSENYIIFGVFTVLGLLGVMFFVILWLVNLREKAPKSIHSTAVNVNEGLR